MQADTVTQHTSIDGADANTTPTAAEVVIQSTPQNHPPPNASNATPTKKRSVSFARGPRSDTDDGHPHHSGPPTKARVLPPYECEPLTRRNIMALEAELGPVNKPSIERLKRRGGLTPTVKRVLPFASADHSENKRQKCIHDDQLVTNNV